MNLIIGGFGEEKEAYAKEKYPEKEIWTDIHLYIKEECREGKTKEEIIEKIALRISKNPDIVVISDEVGNGVVPMDKEDRLWRETTGRVLTYLAGKANSVERIVCGIPMKIK